MNLMTMCYFVLGLAAAVLLAFCSCDLRCYYISVILKEMKLAIPEVSSCSFYAFA